MDQHENGNTGARVVLALVLLAIVIGIYYNNRSPQQVSRPSPASIEPKKVYVPIVKYGEEKVAAARQVMDAANQDCRIYEEAPHLVVEMRIYISDPNTRLAYIRAIADADIILHGQL